MIRRFLARSAHFNAGIREAARRLGLPVVEVRDEEPPVDLAARCLEAIGAR